MRNFLQNQKTITNVMSEQYSNMKNKFEENEEEKKGGYFG